MCVRFVLGGGEVRADDAGLQPAWFLLSHTQPVGPGFYENGPLALCPLKQFPSESVVTEGKTGGKHRGKSHLRDDGKLPSLGLTMIKTQIQIPDYLYDETKRIASDYEMSFAEVVRRGIERIVTEYRPKARVKNWRPPKPRNLGCYPLTDAQLKQLAQDEEPKL